MIVILIIIVIIGVTEVFFFKNHILPTKWAVIWV
jgi:hypothetical protein